MKNLSETPANREKLAQARLAIEEASSEALRRDFYGTVKVNLKIQDGTVQEVSWQVKRMYVKR